MSAVKKQTRGIKALQIEVQEEEMRILTAQLIWTTHTWMDVWEYSDPSLDLWH